jgi:hypothetical protein
VISVFLIVLPRPECFAYPAQLLPLRLEPVIVPVRQKIPLSRLSRHRGQEVNRRLSYIRCARLRPHIGALTRADRAGTGLTLAAWQDDIVCEDVLIAGDAIRGRVRVDIPRVGPARMGLLAQVDRQATVVPVEPCLDAIRRREDRRQNPEVVRQGRARAAGDHIVGVARLHARHPGGEDDRRCRSFARHLFRPIVANTEPVGLRRALLDCREVVVKARVRVDRIVGSKGERKLPARGVEIANPLHEESWKT